jgi:hypothetical protein
VPQCTSGNLFPQKTIYESLMKSNKTWSYYVYRPAVSNVVVDYTALTLLNPQSLFHDLF